MARRQRATVRPRLAGQRQAYLTRQLEAFASMAQVFQFALAGDAARPTWGASIEPIFCALRQDRRMENDWADFDPRGLFIGNALSDTLRHLRLGSPRDVRDP